MKIDIRSFIGEFPRTHVTRLRDEAAELASDVSFASGVLKPFFSIKDVKTLPALTTATKSMHLYRVANAEYWLQFGAFVDVISSPIKDDSYERLYWSGDTRDVAGNVLFSYVPKIYENGAPYPNNWYKLGIPAPTYIPTIISSTLVDEDTVSDETRVYVYTYVNAIGEESAPSNPSAYVTVPNDAATVNLSNLLTDPAVADRNITKKRIYRSLAASNGTATFHYVGEIAASATSFVDEVLGTALNEELPSANWDEPRIGMQGLGLTAYGVAYGFINKIVCLSEPFHVYAWPRDYELTTQYEIVAIGHYESNIIVATTGNPVMITGITPADGMAMAELPINEACISKRSMVSLGHSAIYASPNGLVMASGNGAQLISEAFFDKDEWNSLNPKSIHAIEHRGKYLFFWKVSDSNKGAYIFDPLNPNQGIVQLSIHTDFAYRDLKTDTLYLLQDDGLIQKFDVDTLKDRTKFIWRSKKFRAPTLRGERLLAARVLADSYTDISLKIIADDQLLYQTCTTSDRPFRLPNHSAKAYWQVEVSATDVIREISLAGSMQELMN
jgi:hypothetical protein